ncbi:hypothetical protein QCD60_25165 [Pokkaliibacter sp. MBI-7]|uniref:hypothetical protein n=1 Tax=Pokkaliibacter sp. MBI-7 TaxID=3040600 RepID=UPI002447E393|nr:hypothetical protein [Pokkaliibacter sp. MBI-7]MDH2435824.1 hypothetical protein [Pokkaliibacter sp. MBI-7]
MDMKRKLHLQLVLSIGLLCSIFSGYLYADQSCSASIISAIDSDLKKSGDYILDIACKTKPEDISEEIVALVSASKINKDEYKYIVLVKDVGAGIDWSRAYSSKLYLDNGVSLDKKSIWIDTANYELNEKVRAFGVRLGLQYATSCTENVIGRPLSLFIREHDKVRPVLRDVPTEYFHTLLKQGEVGCDQSMISSTEVGKLYLSMDDSANQNFKDIRLKLKICDVNGVSCRALVGGLKYDGDSNSGEYKKAEWERYIDDNWLLGKE